MPELHESALEHLTTAERACVLRCLDQLRGKLGDRLIEVHLFGSFARGDAWRPTSRLRSDIDLLVICSARPPESEIEQFVTATYSLFLEHGRQVSPNFRTREALESPTTETGIAFWERFRSEGRLLFTMIQRLPSNPALERAGNEAAQQCGESRPAGAQRQVVSAYDQRPAS
jgi:predicted nucleotidyltransferase